MQFLHKSSRRHDLSARPVPLLLFIGSVRGQTEPDELYPLQTILFETEAVREETKYGLRLSNRTHWEAAFSKGPSRGRVMSAGQLINDELITTQLRSDLPAHDEPIVGSAWPTVCRSSEIKIDESHKVLNSPAPGDSKAFYVVLIVGLLAAGGGLTWINLSVSALPFGWGSGRSSTGNPHPEPSPVSPGPEQRSNATSATTPDAQKADRLQISNSIVREVGRDEIAEVLQSTKLSTVVQTISFDGRPLHHRSADAAKELRTPPKLTRTPETKPTTIKGWTLREVSDGTAVLKGPNGVWRATPGQTVPGVGTVNSIVRWGDRLIVATSKGLISTP